MSFITLISMAGVGLGVTSMIVVLSVMDGFESELKKRLMTNDLHVLITPTPKIPGFDAGFIGKNAIDIEATKSALRSRGEIESFEPVVSTEAILRTERKAKGIVFKGVTDGRLERLKRLVTEYAEPQLLIQRENGEAVKLPGIFVGQELAFELRVIPGDAVTLISPTEMEGPMGSIPRLRRYVVEGIYSTGMPEQELQVVFAADSAVRSFLRRSDTVSQWEISVRDFDSAPALANELRRMFPALRVQDWVQLNAHLFASLRLERIAMFIILAFIIVVASFNIVTTLTLMVLEKKREISILKAMGSRDSQIAAIFLWEGLFIGTIGVGGGTLLGFILCLLLKRYQFIELPEIYYDRTLPVTFDPMYYLLVAGSALCIVLIACLYPSRRAARLNPLEGIRFG